MRIYLAAVKYENNSKYLLTSYMEGEKSCLESLQQVGRENFLLDSGVFSMLNNPKLKVDLDAYLDAYIAFIKKHNIKYFFEMDMYSIVGVEATEQMRRKIERETGRKPIPVWHKYLGVAYWLKLIDEYEYIAVAGFASRDVRGNEIPAIRKMVAYAYNKGVKVHGLGFTKTKVLKDFKFYSVDSSSWLTGAIRGRQRHTFTGQRIIARRLGNDARKADLIKLALANLAEWVKYQKHMERI